MFSIAFSWLQLNTLKYFSLNQKQPESSLFAYLVRCLFTNFGWLDSMVGGWVTAKVCGSLQRSCVVISLEIDGDNKVLYFFLTKIFNSF